jgi:hypothetical protein
MDDLIARLERVAREADTADHWRAGERLMPAEGVAPAIRDAIVAIIDLQIDLMEARKL